MGKKKILLLDFHPDNKSFCAAISQEYLAGALESDFEVKKIAVRDLNFDPVLHYGYRQVQELEKDLIDSQEAIKWCEHLVVITPVWWGTVPGIAKGFIDRTFVSGFSHKFDTEKKVPLPLLKGRSASVLYTQGAPWFYSLFFTGDAFWKDLKLYILDFCGFKPVKRKYFDKAKSGTDEDRKNILKTAFDLGKRGF